MCFSSHLNYFSSCPQPVQRLYVVSRLHTSRAGTPAFKRLFLNWPVCSHGHYSLRRAWQSCPSRGPRISDNKHRQPCQRAADTLVRLIQLPLSSRVFQRGRSSSVSGRSPLLSHPKDQNATLSGSSPCTGDLGILKLHPTARWFSVVTPTALSCVSFDCCLCSSGRCLMHMHGNPLLPPPQRNAAIESFFSFYSTLYLWGGYNSSLDGIGGEKCCGFRFRAFHVGSTGSSKVAHTCECERKWFDAMMQWSGPHWENWDWLRKKDGQMEL